MAREDANELRLGPGQPDGRSMAGNPDDETQEPELEANTDRGSQCADGDCNGPRCPGDEDRLGQ